MEISKDQEPFRSVLIFGPPGSGKGTIGRFLSSAGNHFHLSSGDIFRGISIESPAGKLYHNYAGKGLLMPDETTVRIWHHYVHGLIATNRYFPKEQYLLLDGIPRTPRQAELLDAYVQIEGVIVLDVKKPDILIRRMQKRALIEKRTDDMDPNVLKTRLNIYKEETSSVLKHYPKKSISYFNANQKPLEVLRDILVEFTQILS